jgi:hypothetical protein
MKFASRRQQTSRRHTAAALGKENVDFIVDLMLRHKIPFTQRNYIELAYFGEKSSVEELEGEELADLPKGFEDWPVDELKVN